MEPMDLGRDHTLRFISWAPDRTIEPNRVRYEGIPDIERYGAIVRHRPPAGAQSVINPGDEWCEGGIAFDSETARRIEPNRARWTVESWEPLTVSPSLLCACGDHGFIRDGRWVPA